MKLSLSKPDLTDILTVLSLVVAGAVAWGTLVTRVQANTDAINEIKPIPIQVQVLSQKLSDAITQEQETQKDIRELRRDLSNFSGKLP